MLPADKKLKIFGIPNRLLIAIGGSIFCVFVEVLLNAVEALTWEHTWWSAGAPWLIFLIGYLPFFLVSFWVHDAEGLKKKIAIVGTVYAVDILGILVFGVGLGWL